MARILYDCINCGACIPECPVNAISEGSDIHVIDWSCTECGNCWYVCPVNAVDWAPLLLGGYSVSTLSAHGDAVMGETKYWEGVKYVYGGNSVYGIDCSHFVWQVYNGIGLRYSYTPTSSFAGLSEFCEVMAPERGDVVLFSGHMGIYDPYTPTAGHTLYGAYSAGVGYSNPSWWSGSRRYFRWCK